MKKNLEDLSSSSCMFSSQFAAVLNSKIESRFPKCGAFDDTPAIANYIDPHFKGVHIEALGAMKATKEKIKRRLKYLDEKEPSPVDNDGNREAEENIDVTNPTVALLRARKISGEQNIRRVKSNLELEMDFFECNVGMEELKSD